MMQNHWPVLVAAFLISAAVVLGLYRRDQIIEAVSHRNPIPATAPAAAPAAPQVKAEAEPPAQPPATAAKPAQPAQPAPAVVARPNPAAVPPSPAPLPLDAKAIAAGGQPAAKPAQPAQPATPAQKFIMPSNAPPPAQPKPAAPAAAPAPAVAVSDGAQVLFNLRQKIEQVMGRKSTDLATGGYAFQLDGARIEVQPMPNWSVKIYNLGQPADAESETFKKALETVAGEIGFDATQKGTTLNSGKLSLQAATKLGNASVVRDPQNGEVVIAPNQRRVIHAAAPVAPAAPAPAAQAAPAPAPAPAAQPAPAPAPVKVAPAPAPAAGGAPQVQGNSGPATAPNKDF